LLRASNACGVLRAEAARLASRAPAGSEPARTSLIALGEAEADVSDLSPADLGLVSAQLCVPLEVAARRLRACAGDALDALLLGGEGSTRGDDSDDDDCC